MHKLVGFESDSVIQRGSNRRNGSTQTWLPRQYRLNSLIGIKQCRYRFVISRSRVQLLVPAPFPDSTGSTQLTGNGHSLNAIDNTIPPAVGHNHSPAPVVYKISKSISTFGNLGRIKHLLGVVHGWQAATGTPHIQIHITAHRASLHIE